MKRVLLASTILALGVVSASAADIAARPYTKAPVIVEPAFSWTGWYVGLNAGGAFDDRHSETPTGLFPAAYPAAPAASLTRSGFTGGGQIGYNWQFDRTVVGLETDFNYIDFANKSVTTSGLPATPFGFGAPPNVFNYNVSKMNFLGTVRGRLGYTFYRSLFYVTGGLAYADKSSHDTVTFTNAGGAQYANFTGGNSNNVGYTVGGGFEYAWTNNWSVKAEYLFVDLGKKHTALADVVTPGGAGYTFAANSGNQFSLVRAGINYHFGSPVVAKY